MTSSSNFRRKSLSGSWKTNVGDVEIKEVSVQDRYKSWIDEAASIFGGLELCSIEAIVDTAGKHQCHSILIEVSIILCSGQEYIIEINDCAMGLMGEGQDEDRRLIAEIVIKEMEAKCKVPEEKEAEKEVEKEATPASSEVASSSRPESVQSNISKKTEPEAREEVKVKKEHKRDKSEEKEARRAEKEARRAEKEAKREKERKREEERLRQEREEEDRRREEERRKMKEEEERRRKMAREDSEDSEPSVISRQQTRESEDSESGETN